MTVREHISMFYTQVLAKTLQLGHPSYPVVTSDSGPRWKKDLLALLQHRIFSFPKPRRHSYGRHIGQEGNTHRCSSTIYHGHRIRVLGEPAPAVDSAEETSQDQTHFGTAQASACPWKTAGTASKSDNSACPSCREKEHTTQHIFKLEKGSSCRFTHSICFTCSGK